MGLILTVSGGPCRFAAGQETCTDQPVVIRETVNFVPITATVADSQGRNVAGLRKEDFRSNSYCALPRQLKWMSSMCSQSKQELEQQFIRDLSLGVMSLAELSPDLIELTGPKC